MPKIHLLMNEFLRRAVCIWGRVKLCALGLSCMVQLRLLGRNQLACEYVCVVAVCSLCFVWIAGLFVPQTIRTIDVSYHLQTFRTVDVSYHGFFVPSLDFSYRSYHGLFVPSLDVSYRRRNFTYFYCLAVLEQNFSRHTVCNSRYGCELWSLDNTCIKEFDVAWRKAVRRVLKIPADTHSYLLPLLMDMLPFTDDIHERSASFSTACLKSDSTLVRSIAEFVIVGRCRTAGWNCFRMATAV